MRERNDERWRLFLEVMFRAYGTAPRASVEEFARQQFELLASGVRHPREVSDQAISAWIRSDSLAGQNSEARRLWGHGWRRGTEWRGPVDRSESWLKNRRSTRGRGSH